MRKFGGCVAVPLVLVGGLYAILASGVLKSKDQKEAERLVEATCDPYQLWDEKFSSCIQRHFRSGTDVSRLRKYIQGAGFLNWASKAHDNGYFVKYVKIQDVTEKGQPRRKAIIVKRDNRDIILDIHVLEGGSVEGWD
ncbi:MAG TPA: hypothetical protein PKA59_11545 [Chakrabartia sp.]|nr:hypothetical protein [Chakrabartia sp.]